MGKRKGIVEGATYVSTTYKDRHAVIVMVVLSANMIDKDILVRIVKDLVFASMAE